ncbi:hypothetical protein [Magnetospirillum molischianum]|uniref:Uncharacterized protein n=1 Tax=Magnetospirillum molischianum DSM 120 TaxID=1150626 RepID=H8FYC0_MAGML|nr:hypothetical protein [Magnetospirillum molischianum]CCG43358.1 hypothetical protein PHAMO_80149 [Magnetospirillum molischianum DSM 120]
MTELTKNENLPSAPEGGQLPISIYDLETSPVEGFKPGFYYSLAKAEENQDAAEIRIWGPFENAEKAGEAGALHFARILAAVMGVQFEDSTDEATQEKEAA